VPSSPKDGQRGRRTGCVQRLLQGAEKELRVFEVAEQSQVSTSQHEEPGPSTAGRGAGVQGEAKQVSRQAKLTTRRASVGFQRRKSKPLANTSSQTRVRCPGSDQ